MTVIYFINLRVSVSQCVSENVKLIRRCSPLSTAQIKVSVLWGFTSCGLCLTFVAPG